MHHWQLNLIKSNINIHKINMTHFIRPACCLYLFVSPDDELLQKITTQGRSSFVFYIWMFLLSELAKQGPGSSAQEADIKVKRLYFIIKNNKEDTKEKTENPAKQINNE